MNSDHLDNDIDQTLKTYFFKICAEQEAQPVPFGGEWVLVCPGSGFEVQRILAREIKLRLRFFQKAIFTLSGI